MIFLLFAIFLVAPAYAVTPEWTERWQADLVFLRDQLPRVHPAPYHTTAAGELNRELESLSQRLPELSHGEITAELARIVARVGDGHTRLTWPLSPSTDFVLGHATTQPPSDPSLLMNTFPLRLGVYDDGIFVERIPAAHRRILGAQLIGIGELSTEAVIERLEPLISRDNPAQLADLLPLHLVLAEVLHARGVTASPERARFRFRLPDGSVDSVSLTVSREASGIEWVSISDGLRQRPLSWRHLLPSRTPGRGAFSQRHWMEWIAERKTIYLQFNESYDDPEETIYDLAARLREFIEVNPVEAIILDLRYNFGGDNTLNLPLLHALIAARKLEGPGKIRVLIGRGTFSAAMMLALDLEKHVRPLFIGELSGAKPTSYGDSRRTVLPNTGLTVRISTRFWPYSGGDDERAGIGPHIEAAPRWSDVVGGVDRALEVALASSEAVGDNREWRGRITMGRGEAAMMLSLLGEGAGELEISGILPKSKVATSIEGNKLKIVGSLAGKPFLFESVTLGRHLVGHAVYDGRKGNRFPFALAPQ
jgi:hypothetical protein